MIFTKDSLLLAKANNDILLFKNLYPNTPDWGDFIKDLNYKFNSEKSIDIDDHRFINDVLLYNKFDPITFFKISDEVSVQSGAIKKSLQIYNTLNEFFNSLSWIKLILNFVANESKYYIHMDTHDVISWHCIGRVEWRIYKNTKEQSPPLLDTDDEYESYILEPGDILFVPSGIVHQVVVTEPRASILFNCYL